jgi:hypothetical protein
MKYEIFNLEKYEIPEDNTYAKDRFRRSGQQEHLDMPST